MDNPNSARADAPEPCSVAGSLNSKTAGAVDSAVAEFLVRRAAPSASIALILQGKVAYLKAYGSAPDDPKWTPTTGTRYAIGSISKQFTAAAVLLLAEDGKLSLGDPISRWLPALTRAGEVTIRQVLSHTAGYTDYFPQRNTPPMMMTPVSPRSILARWARLPLDFEPGEDWQYSNTGYVIAGLIVEAVSGEKLSDFLRRRIFTPLAMSGAVDHDADHITSPDAKPYSRTALGEPSATLNVAPGWMFAAGNLAMRPFDLALWNLSLLERSLLSPASSDALVQPVWSTSSIGYALGLVVRQGYGRKVLGHSGQVAGYLAENRIYPDDRAAVTVLMNTDCGAIAAELADRIEQMVLKPLGVDETVRILLVDLQNGRLGRTLLTANAGAYFTAPVVNEFARTLGPLGVPVSFRLFEDLQRGGMLQRSYRVHFRNHSIDVRALTLPDGAIEEFLVVPAAD